MRTDFYLLTTDSLNERDHFACRLIEKAFLAKHTLFIATDSDEQADAFDRLLWAFRPDSFVPHSRQTAPHSPVVIGKAPFSTQRDIWLHLSDQLPPSDLPCSRLIEIVPNIPSLQETARQRFRHYRQLGYTLQTHNVN